MRNSRFPDWLVKNWGDRAFQIYFILFLCYIFLPLAVLVLYAFNASEYLTWPLKSLTFHWFQKAFADSRLILALKNSVIIGLATTFFSTLIGGGLAYGLVRFRFKGKALIVNAQHPGNNHLRCCFGHLGSALVALSGYPGWDLANHIRAHNFYYALCRHGHP